MPYKDKNRNREYQIEWRAKRRAELAKLKDKPCVDCGIKFPYYVMDFDHKDSEKLGEIAKMVNKSWDKLLKEIKKCDVVCANCHRIRTHNTLAYVPKIWKLNQLGTRLAC